MVLYFFNLLAHFIDFFPFASDHDVLFLALHKLLHAFVDLPEVTREHLREEFHRV